MKENKAAGQVESRPVRITLTARQSTLNAPFGFGSQPSLFGMRPGPVPPREEQGEVTPENAPEALEYAMDDIIDRDSDGYGFPPEDGDEEGGEGDYGGNAGSDGPADLWELLENMVRSLGEPEEEDSVVIRTAGRLEKRKLPGGYVRLDIVYEEQDPEKPWESAETAVTVDSREPGLITVSRHGSFTSMIVCEEGVRHVTAYRTPFGMLELGVYARRCSSTLTYARGGVVAADYFVEFHGSDLQYSQLRIEAEPI